MRVHRFAPRPRFPLQSPNRKRRRPQQRRRTRRTHSPAPSLFTGPAQDRDGAAQADTPQDMETSGEDSFADDDSSPLPDFLKTPLAPALETKSAEAVAAEGAAPESAVPDDAPDHVAPDPLTATAEPGVDAAPAETEPEETTEPPAPDGPAAATEDSAPPKGLPDLPDLDAIEPSTGPLSALARLYNLSPQDTERLAPVVAQLRALQDRLSGGVR